MNTPFEAPALNQVSEVLHQHLELSHYVETYRQSTERVRWVIFVLMVLSVVVLVAQWNTASASWLRHRLDKLSDVAIATKSLAEPTADKTVLQMTKGRFHTRSQLDDMLTAYRGAVVERVILFEIPGIGVTFDINDLGLFSGVAFSLLLLLLVFALMREYENLYLALFKVRRLHDAQTPPAGGESTANYLYHALAMSQVFGAPPTLAVWRPSLLKRAVPSIVFLLPAAIQGYIIYTNYKTLEIASSYDVPPSVMFPQYILLVSVCVLAAVATAYASASNYRWRSGFLHVNPSYKRVEALPWSVWLRLPFRSKSFGGHLQRRLSAQLVQRLRVTRDRVNGIVRVQHSVEISGKDISYGELQQMCQELRRRAEGIAERDCEEYHFLRANVISSVLHDVTWKVKAEFEVRCKFKDAPNDEESAD